jgi:RNA polymerase sigma-70 factor (ECF subfamily)
MLRESDDRSVMAWLYRTSTRLSIDALRQGRKIESVVVEELPCRVDAAGSAEARAAIVNLAVTVAEEDLAVAVLCRVDGLPHEEAAMVLGVSERTVRRRLQEFDKRVASLRKEFSS